LGNSWISFAALACVFSFFLFWSLPLWVYPLTIGQFDLTVHYTIFDLFTFMFLSVLMGFEVLAALIGMFKSRHDEAKS